MPTWNYAAVHLSGILHPANPKTLKPHLDAISENFESSLAPKKPWPANKMSNGAMPGMMKTILSFRF
ncbi:MAG: transcriptional regulator [Paracoccaceae bacterium]|jgi:transcriptional regulator